VLAANYGVRFPVLLSREAGNRIGTAKPEEVRGCKLIPQLFEQYRAFLIFAFPQDSYHFAKNCYPFVPGTTLGATNDWPEQSHKLASIWQAALHELLKHL
jgi:hypothetical protein